ncbi:TadE/TadG family type IV pilus assembly protein [Kribbella sp. NPDC059898]|uniref:TadE/TadG family type IV pilus assembly protein n=1 Tax=Kribbella sp. NPDC059898 TaxID=3346995 RepID=UPI003662DE2B
MTAPRQKVRPAARRRHPRGTDETGSASLELAILGGGLILIIGLVIAAGRIALAQNSVEDAANAAARSASIARSAGSARDEATAVADSTLRGQNVKCTTRTINVDTSGFAAPIGMPASVTTHVECTVDLSDLLLPGVSKSITMSADGRSAIDEYRERR